MADPNATVQLTIQVASLVSFGGLALKGISIALSTRDAIRDFVREMGTENPPTGMLGRVKVLETKQSEHQDWFVRAGLDRRAEDHDRRQRGSG